MRGGHRMQRLFSFLAGSINAVGGVLLTAMMLLTSADVILRYAGSPLTGTYELMSMAGAVVVGLTLPQTYLQGAHVNLDILLLMLSETGMARRLLMVFGQLLGLALFALLSWALFLKGNDLMATKEVSLTLRLPLYPVAYSLSFCCVIQCLCCLSRFLGTVVKEGSHE